MKIIIGKGYLVIVDNNGQAYPGWLDDRFINHPDLPEVEDVYQKCLSRNYPPEKIIDVLLYVFHHQHIIRSSFLCEMPLVIGFVGVAGSGKSCGAAAVAIYDYMLSGWPVVSNMNIEVTVRYKEASKVFKTINMDKASVLDIKRLEYFYQRCCLLVDEINIEVAEALRTASNRSLMFSYVLQERRKRMLNIIHTTQDEMWSTNRVRKATNLYIKAKDAAYLQGMPKPGTLGRKSHWRIFDPLGTISGIVYPPDDPRFCIWEGVFHNTPFWHSYDTFQVMGIADQPPEADTDIKIKDGTILAQLKDKYREAREIINQCRDLGIKKIEASQLWQMFGITDHAKQSLLGRHFSILGVPKTRFNLKTAYEFNSSVTVADKLPE